MRRALRWLGTGLVLAVLGGATVAAHLQSSDPVIGAITVGRIPAAMALDETTARLFVVNTSAGCQRRRSVWAVVPGVGRRWLPFLPKPPAPDCAMRGSVSVIDTSRV